MECSVLAVQGTRSEKDGAVKIALRLPDRAELGPEYISGPAVREIARGVEAAGFDAVFVTDHPVPPGSLDPRGGHHSLDPFVALACAAAHTEKLRLLTYLCVIPYRNPFLTAKAVATLDVLSGGRTILGAGAGYLRSEFDALGVPFHERNDLFDAAITAMRLAWSGERFSFECRWFVADDNQALPRPVQQPGPPIWIGGNSQRAMRRAIDHGDGWMPFPSPAARADLVRSPGLESTEQLRDMIDQVKSARSGRTTAFDIVFMPMFRDSYERVPEPREFLDAVGELRDIGVTYVVTQIVGLTLTDFLSTLDGLGHEVVAEIATW